MRDSIRTASLQSIRFLSTASLAWLHPDEGYHEEWVCDNCNSTHITCSFAAQDAKNEVLLALDGKADLSDVADKYPAYVELDTNVRTVRVRNCAKEVIATLAVPKELAF